MSMVRAEHFRAKLAESAELIKNTEVPSEIRKLEQSIKSFRHLAQNEDRLADNFDKMIHSLDVPSKPLGADIQVDRFPTRRNSSHISSTILRGDDQTSSANTRAAGTIGRTANYK
jgi:hypothetical protein